MMGLAGDGTMTEEEFISACQNYGICAIDDDDDLRGNKQVRIQWWAKDVLILTMLYSTRWLGLTPNPQRTEISQN
jgi:hypothetical protein